MTTRTVFRWKSNQCLRTKNYRCREREESMMADDNAWTIRLMEENDIPFIAKVLDREGRPPVGLNELLLRNDWKTSPEGCYVAVNSTGTVIGQCATVAFDENEAYFMYYMVDEEYRGRGIGRKMFDASVKALEPRNIALTSREPMTSKYLKGYFPFYGYAIRSLIFKRKPKEPSAGREKPPTDVTLKPLEASMYADVLKYQNSVVKTSEQEFNEVFQKVSSHVTVAIKDGAAVVGFGALQEMADHFRLTPLYAESEQIARTLIGHLLGQVTQGYTVLITIPLVQRDFINTVFEASGFTLESEAFIDKIYSKRNVDVNFEKLFSFWNIEAVYQN